MDESQDSTLADDLVWGIIRILFGWWPVMVVAGILHHDLDRRIPALSFVQSAALTLGLTLFAWFFRR